MMKFSDAGRTMRCRLDATSAKLANLHPRLPRSSSTAPRSSIIRVKSYDKAGTAWLPNKLSPGPLAIHADLNLAAGQNLDEIGRGELTALIGVEYLRLAIALQCFFERVDAKIRIQKDRYPPRQHPPGEPIDHGDQVDETTGHRDVSNIHGPDLIGPGDRQFPRQIRVDLVPRRRFRGVRLAIQRRDPHPFHQRANVLAANLEAFLDQNAPQHPAAREGVIQMQPVDPAHQLEIRVADWAWLVIDGTPADPEDPGLFADAQLRSRIDHFLALGNSPALPSATDKKSFSGVSSPIFACSVFTSITGSAAGFAASPKMPVAPSSS